ncbi:hypothetical protein MSG28_014400, partial [Choristoneura fumiferana]
DKDCELLCPVCFELIDEAYVTRCGHSFCYACIAKSVEQHRWGLGTGDWGHRLSISITNRCGAAVATREHMFPNFMLNELVARRRLRAARPPAPPDGGGDRLRSLLAAESRHLAMPDVELMLEVLTRRKRLLEAESAAAHQRLLYEFLAQLHRHRTQQLAQLAREAALVQADMQTVAGALTELRAGAAGLATFPEDAPAGATADAVHALRKELTELAGSVSDSAAPAPDDEGFAGGSGGGTRSPTGGGAWWRTSRTSCSATSRTAPTTCTSRRRPPPAPDAPATPAPPPRPPGPQDDHVPDNEPSTTTKPPCNGDQRLPEGAGVEPPPAPPGPPPGGGAGGAGGLDAFREDLVSFTRYRALRPLATLSYSSDAINYSTIVSTIVTKRIKVFEYEAVVRDAVDVHYPCAEMQCAHKISCVSWNAYHKNVLASADYEGTVAVWDAGTGQRTRALLEHDKRCWSVHFNRADVRLLASGSDDARVKLWALNADRSVATLEARFNVCCVRFNPRSSCHLAFGSAAHCNNSVSVATLEARFNVCCVRFNPRSSCHLAFGSAAHCNNSVSVATLEARFNVCCVRFNPRSSCHLAFGSAAHCNNSVSVATLEARFNVCCVRFNPRSSCHLAFGSAAHCNNSVSVATLEARFNVCCVRFNPRSSCHLAFGSAAHCNNSVSVATLEARFNVCCVRFNPRSSCHLAFGSAAHCNNSVSVATLEARFNVCCVRFNPRSSCHLAFGSADHCVHYYDLRAPRQPLAVFRDHRCGAWSRRAACAPSPDTPTRRTSWDSPRRPAAGEYQAPGRRTGSTRPAVPSSAALRALLHRTRQREELRGTRHGGQRPVSTRHQAGGRAVPGQQCHLVPRCVRSFTGHANEKNFVGLATEASGRHQAGGRAVPGQQCHLVPRCLRSFTGHANEKNFVGLATEASGRHQAGGRAVPGQQCHLVPRCLRSFTGHANEKNFVGLATEASGRHQAGGRAVPGQQCHLVPRCLRSFTGHANEKNFVGLATEASGRHQAGGRAVPGQQCHLVPRCLRSFTGHANEKNFVGLATEASGRAALRCAPSPDTPTRELRGTRHGGQRPVSTRHQAGGRAVPGQQCHLVPRCLRSFTGHANEKNFVGLATEASGRHQAGGRAVPGQQCHLVPRCVRSFTGHANEKNFVGLATEASGRPTAGITKSTSLMQVSGTTVLIHNPHGVMPGVH